jgi:hypothetical protein
LPGFHDSALITKAMNDPDYTASETYKGWKVTMIISPFSSIISVAIENASG